MMNQVTKQCILKYKVSPISENDLSKMKLNWEIKEKIYELKVFKKFKVG